MGPLVAQPSDLKDEFVTLVFDHIGSAAPELPCKEMTGATEDILTMAACGLRISEVTIGWYGVRVHEMTVRTRRLTRWRDGTCDYKSHGLRVRVKYDLRFTALQLPHDMCDFLLERSLPRAVIRSLAQHE